MRSLFLAVIYQSLGLFGAETVVVKVINRIPLPVHVGREIIPPFSMREVRVSCGSPVAVSAYNRKVRRCLPEEKYTFYPNHNCLEIGAFNERLIFYDGGDLSSRTVTPLFAD